MKGLRDRADAGRELARLLGDYKGENAIVLAIPRGGVVVGFELANALGLPLDVVIVRKLTHPDYPEYAIGAMDESGETLYNEGEVGYVGKKLLHAEEERERKIIEERTELFRRKFPEQDIRGKTVIVADDGVATGYTLQAAIRSIEKKHPKEIIAAVPVIPHSVTSKLEASGVSVVSLLDVRQFEGAVGSYYDSFPEVVDEQVLSILRDARRSA